MVKSHPDSNKVLVVANVVPSNLTLFELPADVPPKIPPRMKKRGPALPEKPPHMRVSPSHVVKESPNTRDVLVALRESSNTREILVAGYPREKPVEKRQREPAKLLLPTSGSSKKELTLLDKPKLEFNGKMRSSKPQQPILLIPRNMLAWGSAPVSYALWMQREPVPLKGGSARRQPVVKYQQLPKLEPISKSGSVTRSSSLTSNGSSGSESGNETFPKSVLKKQKRSSAAKGTTKSNCSKLEQKKNVTFNAFATVQLMEE